MKLLLTGATGFAGGEVLRQTLADPVISQVTVLTRRRLGLSDAKLQEVVVDDFLDYSSVDFSAADACIWCLGVSQTQVTKEEYVRITLDYALAAARAMLAANPRLRFCFLSGRGADHTEKVSTLFGRIKGRTERMLFELGGDVVSFRPGYIRPTAQTGPRKDFARFFAPVGTLISLFGKGLRRRLRPTRALLARRREIRLRSENSGQSHDPHRRIPHCLRGSPGVAIPGRTSSTPRRRSRGQ